MNYNNSEEEENISNQDYTYPPTSNENGGIWFLISSVLSWILHPIVIPSYFTAWVLFLTGDTRFQNELGLQLLGTIAVFTIVFPVFIIVGLKRLGFISSFSMEKRTDRVLPFFFMATIYATCLYTLSPILKLNMLLYSMVLSMDLTVLMAAVISMRTKISAHILSISGIVGFLLASAVLQRDGTLTYTFTTVLIAAGALASARLYLNKHTPMQIVLGALCGAIISFACTFALLT